MNIDKFFSPDSVVIFGVSNSAGNLGRNVLENLDRFRYKGRVYGVGRTPIEVRTKKTFTSVEDIPEIPDLAALLIPAQAVPDALRSCAKKGIKQVIIEAAGFSELGGEKKNLEEEILQIAREAGIAIMGPNCLGTMNLKNRLCMPFVPFNYDEAGLGRNSFVSQSGGLLHDIMHRCSAENIGLNKLASIGNKLMIDENDIIEYFVNDSDTDAIGAYLESVSDGRRLMKIASQTSKPIIILKGNDSPSSREIASFHTAALMGESALVHAAFKQAGIHHAMSVQEIVDCFKIFKLPPMKGPNLVIICRSGGQAVLLADEAYRQQLLLPPPPEVFLDRVREHTKAGVIRNTNPVDLGDVWDEFFYLEAIDMALSSRQVDAVMLYFEYGIDSSMAYEILKGVEELSHRYQKPVVLCMVPDRIQWFHIRYSHPYPFFTESERAFQAIRRSYDHYLRNEKLAEIKKSVSKMSVATAKTSGVSRMMPVLQTLQLLKKYDIPVVPYEIVQNLQEGLKAAKKLSYPVALKRTEPFILHKTESGAVRLNVRDEAELTEAFAAMPGEQYLVQKMAQDGVDAIIGGKRDPQFGPFILFGLGGIFVEILKDVTMRVAPVDEKTALEMIDQIKGAALLKGARGTAMADIKALSKTLVKVSQLLAEHPEIQNLDMNPFRVFKEGTGGAALDVKMEFVE